MRLPTTEHAALPWRVSEIAPDFELLDVWALPATGRREDFADLRSMFENLDPASGEASFASRALFSIRRLLGALFRWDASLNTLPVPGCDETSLRERLPADLPVLETSEPTRSPFRPVFGTDTEWAAEISNATVHAVLQLGWVREQDDTFSGRLGVYVKPRGWFGRLYMAAIAPFRHFVVYPALLRRVGRKWAARDRGDR